jgi:hypothetical protein
MDNLWKNNKLNMASDLRRTRHGGTPVSPGPVSVGPEPGIPGDLVTISPKRRIMRLITVLAGLALAAQATVAGAAPPPARCLYVSSYHAGYEWNDGIERGLHSSLQNRCELRKFYMDGKRNLGEAFAKTRRLRPNNSWKPGSRMSSSPPTTTFPNS